MKKAILTVEQAKALESTKNQKDEFWTSDDIMDAHEYDPKAWTNESSSLNELSIETMQKALYLGYETH